MTLRPGRLALALVLAAACGDARAPAPRPGSTATSSGMLSDADVATLRQRVPTLRPGMTRAEVMAALAVPLDALGQIGSGPRADTTTTYVIAPRLFLALTWDMTTPAGALRKAELERAP